MGLVTNQSQLSPKQTLLENWKEALNFSQIIFNLALKDGDFSKALKSFHVDTDVCESQSRHVGVCYAPTLVNITAPSLVTTRPSSILIPPKGRLNSPTSTQRTTPS